jgi:chemotaxis protein CheD
VVRQSRFLGPGDWQVGEEPCRVETVLGSCVAVTAHCARRGVGAICHCVLPARGMGSGSGTSGPAMYVESCIPGMFEWFEAHGMRVSELELKVFGGADMELGGGVSTAAVGRRNVEALLALVDARGLRLAASDVGGSAGRKMIFYSDTGEVWVKQLERAKSSGRAAHRKRS